MAMHACIFSYNNIRTLFCFCFTCSRNITFNQFQNIVKIVEINAKILQLGYGICI